MYRVSVIGIIIAPPTSPQSPHSPQTPPPALRLDRLDHAIIDAIRAGGPVGIWTLLNDLADAEVQGSHKDARMLRLELWSRLRRLLRLELVYRDGRTAVSATKPPPAPRRPRRSWAGRRSVQLSTAVGQGSTRFALKSDVTESQQQKPYQQQQEGNCPTSERPQKPAKSKCGPARHEAGPKTSDCRTIREAAKELAALRGRKKQWTGYIGRIRLFRGQQVRLPSGQPAFVYGCRRGLLVHTDTQGRLLGGFGEPLRWGVVRVANVTLLKNEAATVLGSRKHGRTERRSAAKAEAARINGRRPVKPGSRPRGRPRTAPLPQTPKA